MNKLTEIKEALSNATSGPWKVFRDKSLGETLIGTAYDHPQLKGPNSIVGHVFSKQGEYVYIRDYDADLIAHAPEYIGYLLSLLEEKDKALEKLANDENYLLIFDDEGEPWRHVWFAEGDQRSIARKALNTSSNNEGGTQS